MKSFERGRAWIELDMAALKVNTAAMSSILPPGCRLMPAVKADAYGHGAALIAPELQRLGVDAFCVASAEEGAELRGIGVTGEILVLGWTHPENFRLLKEYSLTQTAVDCAYARLLDGYGGELTAHLAIDTGMHRLGEPCMNTAEILSAFSLPHLRITGVFTHLCADDTLSAADAAYTERQASAFRWLLSELHRHGVFPKAHILGSYGLINYPQYGGDYARVGLALFGVLSRREDVPLCPVRLRPVLSLRSRVTSVRTVAAGECVGYGLAYTAGSERRIASVGIGYADGVPRSLSCGAGSVLIAGRRAPIVGRVCMDQLMADVTDIPGVQPGDIVTLIGRDGGEEISAYDLAEADGTITNEILSRLGRRPARIRV